MLLYFAQIDIYIVLAETQPKHYEIALLQSDRSQWLQLEALSLSSDARAIRRAHINQHYAEIIAEVNTGMHLADRRMVKFKQCKTL